jgi:hypothetical protein
MADAGDVSNPVSVKYCRIKPPFQYVGGGRMTVSAVVTVRFDRYFSLWFLIAHQSCHFEISSIKALLIQRLFHSSASISIKRIMVDLLYGLHQPRPLVIYGFGLRLIVTG